MPFALIAVMLLLMATVAGAVMAEHARVGKGAEEMTDGTSMVELSLEDIASYVDRELGLIILDISRDDSLGGLDDRADAFRKRSSDWLDYHFPMSSYGMRADLLESDLDLTAESFELMGDDGDVGGYSPSYLHGSGTVKVSVDSWMGGITKELSISTDGSYALPLAAEQGSMFENMVGGNGITLSQMISYQLQSLAQYRVINGYGAADEFGDKGTHSIITRDDVENAYVNALEMIGLICFRDGDTAHEQLDLADMIVGETIRLDLAALYGQTLMSAVDDIALKWYDYLCIESLTENDRTLDIGLKLAAAALIGFFTGTDSFSAAAYIEEIMELNGIPSGTYRFPGSGTTTVYADGYAVTVDNPVSDLLEKDWIRFFSVHYESGRNHIMDTIKSILNAAATNLYRSDLGTLTVRTDMYDKESFSDTLIGILTESTEGISSMIEKAVTESLSSDGYADPFYSAIAYTVMRHADDIADTDELRSRIIQSFSEIAEARDLDLEDLLASADIDAAVHSYRSKVYSDLSVYQYMAEVKGNGPDLLHRALITIAETGLVSSGIMSRVPALVDSLIEDIERAVGLEPGYGPADLPPDSCFLLIDASDNVNREHLTFDYNDDLVISEPSIVHDRCIHMTGIMEDYTAGYSTTFGIRIQDSIEYTVTGWNELSSSMGAGFTSSVSGRTINDMYIEITVASAWALTGIRYSASDTVWSDALTLLYKLLEPVMEPLMKIMEMVKQFIDLMSRCVMEIARYVSDALLDLYDRTIGPIAEMAEWVSSHLESLVSQGVLDIFYSLNLKNQTIGFEYMGYTFEIELNLASLFGSVKTLFTATLKGMFAGLDVTASITAKVKGEMHPNNAFVTGKATVMGEDWKVSMSIDPLMKSSRHLLTVSARIRDVDIDAVLPNLDDYHELGVTLSRIPGIGEMLSSIPVPMLGVNVGLDAGISVRYSSPVTEGLIINEFESNPKGNDTGGEWVELLNNTNKEIDLDGYTLIASSDRSKKKMVLSGSIAPGEFLVLEPTFLMVNSSGKLTKNGEGLTLKDPDGSVVDKTPIQKDGSDDGKTWQRTYDGSGEWEFKDATMGRTNGSYVSSKLISVDAAKDIMKGALEDAFSEIGSITDVSSLQDIIRLTVKNSVDRIIKKVAGCFVEASVFVEVDVLDPTSSASGGIRVSLRCDSDLVEDVLKYIAGKIESVALSMKNPYKIDGIGMFTDNIDLEVTFKAKLQFPKALAHSVDELPEVDMGVVFRTNISALLKVYGKDYGTPGVECGIRIVDCPAAVIPAKLSPKNGMEHDLWLIRVNIEWD